MQSWGPYSKTNLGALSWVPATTMILGHGTPWTEVERVPTEHVVEIEGGSVSVHPFSTGSSTPPEEQSELPELYDQAIDGLVARYRWYLSTGIRLEAHLTGGKDSRTSLALLLAAGGIESLERIVTLGSEHNGDVIVARQIAESLGVDRHEVQAGPKTALEEVDWEDYRDWFAYSPWRYELYVTPWDGRQWISDGMSPIATLTGGGGEVVRGGFAPDAEADVLDANVDWFMRWYDRHNAIDVIGPETKESHRAYARQGSSSPRFAVGGATWPQTGLRRSSTARSSRSSPRTPRTPSASSQRPITSEES